MDNSNIINTLNDLSSTKVKDRNHAFNDLTSILKQSPDAIPTKLLPSVTETIIELLDAEHRSYCNLLTTVAEGNTNKLSLSENRLSTISYILRLLIEKTSARFCIKTLRFLMNALPELMLKQSSKSLLEPVSIHLSFALLSMITSDLFQLKFALHQWITLSETICNYFDRHMEVSLNDRNITNFLSILDVLISMDTIGLSQLSSKIQNTVLQYIRQCDKENANTKITLKLINNLIVKTHCLDISNTLILIPEVWNYYIKMGNVANKDIQSELTFFDLTASELVVNNILQLIDNDVPHHVSGTEIQLVSLEEYLILRISRFKPQNFLLRHISFLNYTNDTNSWFAFSDFQLRFSSDPKPWVELLGITKLLIAYYHLIACNLTINPLFKKRKLDDNLNVVIKDSLTIEEFLWHCLESKSTNLQYIGLQITAFYATLTDIDEANCKKLMDIVFEKFENTELVGWTCLALIPLITQKSFSLKQEVVVRLFKMCLPLIKIEENCNVSCALLTNCIKYSSFLISDKSIFRQISDIYTLADINGPILISNESFEFWKYLDFYSKDIDSKGIETSSQRVYDWLMFKWKGDLLLSTDNNQLYSFLAWLCGNSNSNAKPFLLNDIPLNNDLVHWTDLYFVWQTYCKQRTYLLQARIPKKSENLHSENRFAETNTCNNPLIFNNIVTKSMEQLEMLSFDIESKLKWLCQISKFLEYFRRDSRYENALMNLTSSAHIILTSLHFDTISEYSSICNELLNLEISLHTSKMFSLIPLKDLVEALISFQKRPVLKSMGSDFDDMSLQSAHAEESYSTSVAINPFYKSQIKNAVQTILYVSEDMNSPNNDEQTELVLYLLNSLKTEDFIKCLTTAISWLSNTKVKNRLFLENLTQLIGLKLLSNKYNTSASAIYLLSYYLDSVRSQWLDETNDAFHSDCNDIFQWIQLRFDDISFSGILPLTKFSNLLINILQFHDLSSGILKGKKQHIFATFTKCIKLLDYIEIINLLPAITSYMSKVSFKNQAIIFHEIRCIFENNKHSIECSSFYSLAMFYISTISYTNLVNAISDMDSYPFSPNTNIYIDASLKKISNSYGLDSLVELFEMCKYDIINLWVSKTLPGMSFENSVWQISLFGYDNLNDFIIKYTTEIGAALYSTPLSVEKLEIQLQSVTKQDSQSILTKCLPISIALAFVKNNIKDKIFDIVDDVTGQSSTKFVEHHKLVVLKWILVFTDLGSTAELNSLLEKYYPKSKLRSDLFDSDVTTIKYQFPLNISLSTSLQLFRNKLSIEPIDIPFVKVLVLWILSDLDASQSELQKIRNIREIKLLSVIYEKQVGGATICELLLQKLSKLISDVKLHDEVMSIILTLLKIAFLKRYEVTSNLITIFSQIMMYIKVKTTDDLFLVAALINLVKTNNKQYSEIWAHCEAIVCFNNKTINVNHSEEIGNLLSYGTDGIILLSLILSYTNEINTLSFTPSESNIKTLLNYDIPEKYCSRQFKLWISQCITSNYLAIINPKNNFGTKDNKITNLEFIFNEPGSLTYLYKIYFDYQLESSNNMTNYTLLISECILGVLVSHFENSAEPSLKINEQLYEMIKDNSYVMDDTILSFIIPSGNTYLSLDDFLENYFSSTDIEYIPWLSMFARVLIDQIAIYVPHVKIFNEFCSTEMKFSEICIPLLFYLSIYMDIRNGVKWATKLLLEPSILLKTKCYKKKLNIIFEIISMVRCGKRNNERYYSNIYDSLDLQLIYDTAIKTNNISFAYMILEEYQMNSSNRSDDLHLLAIYESLDESDFMAGLPVPHTLTGVMQSMDKTDPSSWKQFLFSNAKLDSDFVDFSSTERNMLITACESNGFYGLAAGLESTSKSIKDLDPYKWGLELGNWDLPEPKSVYNKESGLYYSLRNIYHETTNPIRNLEDSIIKIIDSENNFKKKLTWIDTVHEVSLWKNLLMGLESKEKNIENLSYYSSLNRSILNFSDFEEYKSNLKSRYMLTSVLSQSHLSSNISINPVDLKLSSISFLSNLIELAIQENYAQDALKNVMILENLVDRNAFLPKYVNRVKLYLIADALWCSKEFKTPIMILKNMVEERGSQLALDMFQEYGRILSKSNDQILSTLVRWTSESRYETASDIYDRYISGINITVSDPNSRADIFYILGDFFSKQVHKFKKSSEINEMQQRCEVGILDLQALKTIYTNKSLPENERKDAKRHYNKASIQYEKDRELLDDLKQQNEKFVKSALHYYMNVLIFSNEYDNDVLDKFCGLWFEYDKDDVINAFLQKEIGTVPSWKFLPWVNQIASKLSLDNSRFQKPLQLTLKRLLYKLPYDSLYSVIGILFYKSQSHNVDTSIMSKVNAVDKILKELHTYENGEYYRDYVIPVQDFCENAIDLANLTFANNTKALHLQNLNLGSYWLKQLPFQKLPLPTVEIIITTSSDGKAPRPYITSVKETVEISSTGLSLPKILTFYLSDGSRHKVLLKGSNDDLRQDAIMEQVFKQVNKILRNYSQIRKFDLSIRTYEVIPLGPRAGIIGFVSNSISLHQILTGLHKDDEVSFDQARKAMKSVQTKFNSERLKVFEKLTSSIKPQLRNSFFNSFTRPQDWLEAKKKYTKGTAVISIVGHILGLGDRHLNNILLDQSTGEPIHIDLGIAFDQGRLLPVPELVPFRLSRDIVDGFGVTGIEGMFRRNCERVYGVLRKDYEKVLHVLNILKWDPLYSWVMSPVRKHQHLLDEDSQAFNNTTVTSIDKGQQIDENKESYRAIKGVEEKLIGGGLSIEATVQEVIQQATNPNNLSVIYMGWSPFY